MDSVKNILDYYILTNKLKDTIRSGWKVWNVKKIRLESVAEHVFGTCMLAVAIWSETLPPVNLSEVLLTLALHETEEIIIGDLTPLHAKYAQKAQLGREAVAEIFKNLRAKEVFETLLDNFEKKSTPEAIFAYKCDKLECDIQIKLYEEKGFAKIENADNLLLQKPSIKKLTEMGAKKISDYFIINDRSVYKSDSSDIFENIINYVQNNKLVK